MHIQPTYTTTSILVPYHKRTGPTHYYMVEHVQIFNYEVLQRLHSLSRGTHSPFHWYIILYRYIYYDNISCKQHCSLKVTANALMLDTMGPPCKVKVM